jgi:hypothetical protein
MVRLHGRAKLGQRLIDNTPFGHWKTSTFTGALRHDGVIAPGVCDGAINGDLCSWSGSNRSRAPRRVRMIPS